jgi:hypothetical protein
MLHIFVAATAVEIGIVLGPFAPAETTNKIWLYFYLGVLCIGTRQMILNPRPALFVGMVNLGVLWERFPFAIPKSADSAAVVFQRDFD